MNKYKKIFNVFMLTVMVALLSTGMDFVSKAQASDVMTYLRFEDQRVTTADVYRVDGRWDSQRVKDVHEPIIQHILQQADNVPEGKRPICFMYGGGSASGKSTVVNKIVAPIIKDLGLDMPTVDSDAIKEMLPEFNMMRKQNNDTWAMRTHTESSYITRKALEALIEKEKCFQYDGTMRSFDAISPLIANLKKHDYEVHIVGVDIPLEMALERAKARDRVLDPSVVENTHKGFASSFLKICNLDGVTDYFLYSNIGAEPELILDNKGVYNETLYKQFLAKGGNM